MLGREAASPRAVHRLKHPVLNSGVLRAASTSGSPAAFPSVLQDHCRGSYPANFGGYIGAGMRCRCHSAPPPRSCRQPGACRPTLGPRCGDCLFISHTNTSMATAYFTAVLGKSAGSRACYTSKPPTFPFSRLQPASSRQVERMLTLT